MSKRWRWFWFVVATVMVADQGSKIWSLSSLTNTFEGEAGVSNRLTQLWEGKHPLAIKTHTVISNFWHFRYVENPGAAWGFLSRSESPLRTPFFLVVGVGASIFILLYARKLRDDQKRLNLALAMVMGGALGNFIDRIRLGYVIDFIDWHWYRHATWPTFNIADAGITIGVAIMLLDSFMPEHSAEEATAVDSDASDSTQAAG